MKKIYEKLVTRSRNWILLPLLFAAGIMQTNAQVLIPYNGNSTLACGTSTRIMDHAGSGNYSNYAYGYVVLDGGYASVMAIDGTYDTESFWDYVTIYDGAGTGGNVIGSWDGYGTVNYTTTPGQTVTIEFSSDGSITYPGIDFTVTSTGACFATPCSGTPPQNTVVGPTVGICPGATAKLGLANSYSVGDLAFQWQASTQSSVGLWSNVTSGSKNYQTSPLSTDTWYQVIVTCSNTNQSVISGPYLVEVQGVHVDSIPYFEGFEGITEQDELPNCSWAADNLGNEAFTSTVSSFWDNRVPHNGNNFASFYYWPGNTNSFYTNGIYLNAGVTYSASVWYITDPYLYDNWEDLSILAGPNQGPTGQFVVASTPGAAIAATYKSLSNTFTVASTGVYYFAVRTTVNTNSYAYYLSWDDLSIIAPCSLNPINLNLTASTTTVCSGAPLTLSAAGATSYSWNVGGGGQSVVVNPTNSQLYTVTGTSSLTGCISTESKYITVNPAPFVAIVADKQKVCSGSAVNLTAVGDAQSYNWSLPGASGIFASYTPANSGTVSVQGSNQYGCTSLATINVSVVPLPGVSGVASPASICIGDYAVLTGIGAVSYQWTSNSSFIITPQAVVNPVTSTQYTVTGTDANGCTNVNLVDVEVKACAVGVTEHNGNAAVSVYPNPNTGVFSVSTPQRASISVTDVSGRIVSVAEGQGIFEVNINHLANGIYQVKVQTESGLSILKVIKE
jgi:hypothetical protein